MPQIIEAQWTSPVYMPHAASCPISRKRRAGVEQAPHPLARQQLAALEVPFTRLGVSAERDQRDLLLEVVDHGAHPLGIAFEFRRPWIDLAFRTDIKRFLEGFCR
jgi:hypothetical protein